MTEWKQNSAQNIRPPEVGRSLKTLEKSSYQTSELIMMMVS